jgi:hypothetical protein
MTFEQELSHLINRYSKENGSNTPDFILAQYLVSCLAAYNETVVARAKWYGHIDNPGIGAVRLNNG